MDIAYFIENAQKAYKSMENPQMSEADFIADFIRADVTPVRHGEWLLKHIGHGHYWECSECHTNPCIYVTENTKFCPNCGARMDESGTQPQREDV